MRLVAENETEFHALQYPVRHPTLGIGLGGVGSGIGLMWYVYTPAGIGV